MSRFVDLSHTLETGMPGSSMTGPDGRRFQATAEIATVLDHEESAPLYDGKAAFAFTRASFHTSIGTYVDSPFVRFPAGRDVAALTLDELILPGRRVAARGRAPGTPLGFAEMDLPSDLEGRAVLVDFGWDAHWGTATYGTPPFIARDAIDALIDAGVRLVGLDTPNADDRRDPERPAHTRLLAAGVLIVENLRNLAALGARPFRFYALPVKARGAASMPVRAFGEFLDGEAAT